MKHLIGAAGAILITLIASPLLASALSNVATTTINATIAPSITVSTNSTVTLSLTPTGAGVQSIQSDTASVSTNDPSGYTLGLDESTSGANAGKLCTASCTNTIAAVTGSQSVPVAETAGTWGYRVDGVGGFGAGPTTAATNTTIGAAKFALIPANGSPDTLKTTATVATSDPTTVWYGVAANTSQAVGTYSNVVEYTATAN